MGHKRVRHTPGETEFVLLHKQADESMTWAYVSETGPITEEEIIKQETPSERRKASSGVLTESSSSRIEPGCASGLHAYR
jgi:hypothetical protein